MKNNAASVRQRLLNLARKESTNYDYILRQFVAQRLLYRLSISEYAKQFCLKGALLFWIWDSTFHRPTYDIDLLGFGDNDLSNLKDVFSAIVKTHCDDALEFKMESIKAERIKEETQYPGVRISGQATLSRAVIPFQVDIGFGDAITPKADLKLLPSYLNFPQAKLRTYPVYTVIAEKFQAMVDLDIANSRMKDFFDLWFIASTMNLKEQHLIEAVEATFINRKTDITTKALHVFSNSFLVDVNKNIQWQAFLNKNRIDCNLTFSQTQEKIKMFLEPVYFSIARGNNQDRNWNINSWSWI